MKTIDVLFQLMRKVGHHPVPLRDDLGFDVLLQCDVCEKVFYIWTRRTRGDVIMVDGKILGGASDEIPLDKIKEYMCQRFENFK